MLRGLDDFQTAGSGGGGLGGVGSLKITRHAPLRTHPLRRPLPQRVPLAGVGGGVRGWVGEVGDALLVGRLLGVGVPAAGVPAGGMPAGGMGGVRAWLGVTE
nr:hypothetical protein KitaXyl93_37790 [Kitasatospora sp. Xyl93]